MFSSGTVFLFLGALLAAVEAMPKLERSTFNFTHVSDDGSFTSAYQSKNSTVSQRFDDDELQQFIEENKSNKIFRGSYAALGQFPFMAIIHHLVGNGKYFVCGGSILSKRWVLTAAHCVVNKPQTFLVVFGVTDKAGVGYDYIKGKGVAMISRQGAIYSNYALGHHDIALLYMPNDIPFSDTIQPIRIAGASYRDRSFVNKNAFMYGWGKTMQGGDSVMKMFYGQSTVVSTGKCRVMWNVDASHICTDASHGQDVCQGDSGGPLVVLEDDDEPLQIGIVSYGDGGCPGMRPSVYTRVSAYYSWIKRVTGINYE